MSISNVITTIKNINLDQEKNIIPEYDEDGHDIKCWYCNSRGCDAVVDGRYYHKSCDEPDEAEEEGDCVDDSGVTCDVCKTETTMAATVGCCVNEGKWCGTNNMCADCGKYDEDTDEWTCNKCLKPTIVYTGIRRKRILPPSKIL